MDYTSHYEAAIDNLRREDHFANSDSFQGDREEFCRAYRERAMIHAMLHTGDMVATLVDHFRSKEH